MPDMGLKADSGLSAANRAVRYLLDRIQTDVDLRYVCGRGSESFHLLCEAEAECLGESVDAIVGRRMADLTPEHHRREPEIVRLRRESQSQPDLLAALKNLLRVSLPTDVSGSRWVEQAHAVVRAAEGEPRR